MVVIQVSKSEPWTRGLREPGFLNAYHVSGDEGELAGSHEGELTPRFTNIPGERDRGGEEGGGGNTPKKTFFRKYTKTISRKKEIQVRQEQWDFQPKEDLKK